MSEQPITWTRITAGSYLHRETGVQIAQGESGNWFVYRPQPGTPGMACEGSRATLAHAKLIGKSSVRVMRFRREADHEEAMTIAQTTDNHSRGRRVRKLVVTMGATVDEAKALVDETDRLLADGADALVHFWPQGQPLVDLAVCHVNIMATPYTFGSPELGEVTCPSCKHLAARRTAAEPVITLIAPLDNGAAVDEIRERAADLEWTYDEAEAEIMRVTGCTPLGAYALIFAESTAALAGGC